MEQSRLEQLYNGSKEADIEAVEGEHAFNENLDRRQKLEVEGKNGSEEADSKRMASLPLVLEKMEESQVKIIPDEENSPIVVNNFDVGHYDSIVVMLLGVDKIRKVKEEQGAAIWFGSFAEEGVVAI